MTMFSSPRCRVVRRFLSLAAVVGLTLLMATAKPVSTAEGKKTGDGDRPAAKEAKPRPPAKIDAAGPPEEPGLPPGPPPGKDQPQPKPPRSTGTTGKPDWRGPARPGEDGPQRRFGPFGPGMPMGPMSRGPRPDWGPTEQSDPEIFKLIRAENELDRRTREMARSYRESSKEERPKLKEDLKKVVTQQFESRQQRRTLELKRLEDELKRLRDAMDRREKERPQIIDKRVSELLGEEPEPGF